MKTTTTKCVNGLLAANDLVISTNSDEYSFLIGEVLQINLLGSPEHNEESQNQTDDVHVNFMAYEYSPTRVIEIEDELSYLYGMKKTLCESPLDDVIMAPDSLIRITGIDEKQLTYLLESGYNAAGYCCKVLDELLVQAGSSSSNEPSDVMTDILRVVDHTLPLAGYKVMDGDRNSVIVRHGGSDTDFEIKVATLI